MVMILIVLIINYLFVGSLLAHRYYLTGWRWCAMQLGWAFIWLFESNVHKDYRAGRAGVKSWFCFRGLEWVREARDYLPEGAYRDGWDRGIYEVMNND